MDELIVVDNNSIDETQTLVKNFKKNVTFPVVILSEKKQGYAPARNLGLHTAQYDWVTFIDDDCVADKKWLETIILYIKNHLDTAVVVGGTKTYNQHNPYSLAFSLIENLWKESRTKKDLVLSYDITDTKNITYNRNFLAYHNIWFDEKRKNAQHGAEDSDLGLQIEKHEGRAAYVPAAYVYHKDPENFIQFYKKNIYHIRSGYFLTYKWPNIFLSTAPEYSFLDKLHYVQKFKKEARIGSFLFFLVFIHFLAGNVLKKSIWRFLRYIHKR